MLIIININNKFLAFMHGSVKRIYYFVIIFFPWQAIPPLLNFQSYGS